MLQNAMICPWCFKNLKGMELPQKTSELHYRNATHLSMALELWNVGYQCEECGCRWTYDGKIIRNGKEELKDKYKVEENKNNINDNKDIINNKENQEENE